MEKQARSCIAGIFLPSSNQVMSISEAKSKGLLTPGTALILLEAQAATGFMIDPVRNQKLSVEKAVASGVINMEWKAKLLSAEMAVTGYTDHYTGDKISLLQAMQKGFIVKDHGIRLLEAQIATGGIIDPVLGHRMPVEVAYQQGYFDEEMNQILVDPSDDTKGFFDPNTMENLTYLQLLQRCVTDSDTGLSLLVLTHRENDLFVDEKTRNVLKSTITSKAGEKTKGKETSVWDLMYSMEITEEKRRYLVQQYSSGKITIECLIERMIAIIEQDKFIVDDGKTNILKSTKTSKAGGTFHGVEISLWDLLNSKYILEEKRKELLQQYCSGKITIEHLLDITISITQQNTSSSAITDAQANGSISFLGIRKDVTAVELLESKIIDDELYKELRAGEVTTQSVSEMDSVQKYLQGTNCIAGVFLQSSKKVMSITEARTKGLLTPGTSLILLEAQAATGFIIDPVQSKKLSVEEAVASGVVSAEWKQKLLSAERAVTGYTDPSTGEIISLFQALQKELIVRDHGIRLLEAQIATGGIIDPVHSHRVPVEVAYQRGYFDEKMNEILLDPSDDTKGFFEPNTKENLTYLQLLERSVTDPETGLSLLVIAQKRENHFVVDDKMRNILKSTKTSDAGGIFFGVETSLWDLLYSKNITEIKRKELLQQYRSGKITVEDLMEITVSITQQNTLSTTKTITKTNSSASVLGIRKDVTAHELEESKLIEDEQRKGLKTGAVTLQSENKFVFDEKTRDILKSTKTRKAGGTFHGLETSLWDLLYSKYINEGKRKELLQQYCFGKITIERLTEITVSITQQNTSSTATTDEQANGSISLPGIRKDVTAVELLESKIIDNKLYKELRTGEVTTQSVSEMDSVQKYLQGTNCIAGVFLQSNKQVMSITEARTKGLLTPGTSLILLEAQAATGFIIDPVQNKKLSVEEAVASGVVSAEWKQKLLSAERAVTGYTDPYTGNIISLFQALQKELIVRDHGIRLLEAQIATDGIIDPVHSHRVPVEVAYQRGYFDEKMNEILLDPSDDTKGFFDPNTKENLTYLQLLERSVTDPKTGLSLLVIAQKGENHFVVDDKTRNILKSTKTSKAGGIFHGVETSLWDLLYSKNITEIKRKELLQQYCSGKITVEHLMEITVSITQQNTLSTTTTITQTNSSASSQSIRKDFTAEELEESKITHDKLRKELRTSTVTVQSENKFIVDEKTKEIIKSTKTTKAGGTFHGLETSLWDLLHSKYITEGKRKELLQQYCSGKITIERLTEITISITQQKTSSTATTDAQANGSISFHGIRKDVTAVELLESKIIDDKLYKELRTGEVTTQSVSEMDSVQKYLRGTNCIAGVFLQSKKQVMSISQAKTKGLLTPGTSLILLEAQAATGFIIDPVQNKKLSVEEAVASGVVTAEWKQKLLSAERAVTGYTDPYTGAIISLFQALQKELIVRDHGIRLLEAQIATGGIIDPVHSHRVPVEVAYQRGYFDEKMNEILLDPSDDTKGFFEPNTKENLTYLQLLERSVTDPETGLSLLVIAQKGENHFVVDDKTRSILKSTKTNKAGGIFHGVETSLWDLLYSKSITEIKRKELLQRYCSGKITVEHLMEITVSITQQKTSSTAITDAQANGSISFHGIRIDVTAVELLESKIIDDKLYKELRAGEVTTQSVSEMDSVQKYLQGTNCIAGVFLQSNKQVMSISQAKTKGLLTPGTSLILLEAQAATGFIIDPVQNKKLSVEEAVASGVVSAEWKQKLLSAERAVTGYTDPYTGNIISLFQALQKELIVRDHGIRLLEAQIATGGIIDPVHSHRVPVEVAYQRGYFDEKMNEILLDPSDDTKGFFDPNTKENLTYLQLLERSVTDPKTGLSLLVIAQKGENHFVVDDKTRNILKSTKTSKAGGIFHGVETSLWDLLYSKNITEIKRKELLQQYCSGKITVEHLMEITVSITQQNTLSTTTTITQTNSSASSQSIRKDFTAEELEESKITHDKLRKELRTSTVTVQSENKFIVDEKTKEIIKSTKTTKAGGKFHGLETSLWDLLHSKYITEGKRKELLQQYCSGKITIERLTEITISITQQKTSSTATTDAQANGSISFHGIRKDVTAVELLESKIIDDKLYKELRTGEVTTQSVSEMDSVQKYLRGTNCIAGVFLQSNKQVMSISQAKTKGLLTPGTSLILLEAQAATGFIIDPVQNKKLSVEEAVASGVVTAEWKQKLLSAERAVTGYTDPYTGAIISLFQALQKELIVRDHGIRLLEAQIATGGIIDPVHSHRVPVEVAYQRGYFDEKMNEILLDPSDDTKGFFEPNTKENLTYLQLLERSVTDPETGLSLLVIAQKGENHFVVDDKTRSILKSTKTNKAGGIFHGVETSLWDLLYSKSITEIKRKELLQRYCSGKITVEHLMEITVSITQQKTSSTAITDAQANGSISFHGIRKDVTAVELLESKIIDDKLYKELRAGEVTTQSVSEMDSVQKYLQGTNCIAGVFLQSKKQVMSISQAKTKGLLTPGTSLILLEAQAATGFIIDPVQNKKLSVEEAVASGVVTAEWKQKLLSAERAVTGYTDPYTGAIISLFQALQKELIVRDHGIRLLEAQIATGGIIDPVHSHRVPVEVAYQRGYFDEKMNEILLDPSDDTKGFFEPNTKENLTYLQLLERSVTDPETGLSLLVIAQKGENHFVVDDKTRSILKSTKTNKAGGIFHGVETSLWDLLYSKSITEIKRKELLQRYCSGKITVEHLMEITVSITQQKTSSTAITDAQANGSISFHGIRKDVTAVELLESKIIDDKLYKELRAGEVTTQSVSEMDSVQKYLQGTNCIAGVFLQSNKQVMSISQAKTKGLLTPGTSLILLEAQAATGFIIDPVQNKKLSVEEAVASGVVTAEWKQKLLSAERAVTGYTDPYTGAIISLFQALQKELIVRDHGIRLLEAQIATGGIIDPVHSHRVPVEVAYQRGYFDEKMNEILLDPSDDTKGFFEPNTKENLTYLQLLERSVTDPETGLSLLVIAQKGENHFVVDDKTRSILKSTKTNKAGGIFHGVETSLWDLLYSKSITEIKRKELLQRYCSGKITVEHLMEITVSITQQKTSSTAITDAQANGSISFHGIRKDVTAVELLESKIIDDKLYKELRAGEVTTQSVSEMDSVQKYLQGTNCIAGVFLQSKKQVMSISQAKTKGLLTPGTSLILLEAQAATGFIIDPVQNKKLSVEEAVASGVVTAEWKQKLLSAERAVTGYTDPYTGAIISLFQALQKELIVRDHGIRLLEAQIATGGIIDPVHSHRVPVEVAYQRGYFDEKMNEILLDPSDDTKGFFEPNTKENLTYLQLLERSVTDPETGLSLLVIAQKGENHFVVDDKTRSILKSTKTNKAGGIFHGVETSLWDLLYSKSITEIKRKELLQRYCSGKITVEHLMEITVSITQQKTSSTAITDAQANGSISFHGIRKDVTAVELLESKIIDDKLYKELRAGEVTTQSVSEMDSVQKYLQGTNCIAGVFLQSNKQVMSISQAKTKGLLTPGTSLILLEAQAATGFIIDPVQNKKLSVEEAVASGVVTAEWKQKLLSAERAVTGYTDPYTGAIISLFQALQKELIVRDHGIRLLEAQIATGGIIDPVHSHRVPVEVAYQRGYFDEKMNEILLDPSDDTKGFFEPNTKENLTYLQLLERSMTDPETGLSLLVIAQKGENHFVVDDKTRSILKSTKTNKAGGIFHGVETSLWDLLYSKSITEIKRKELLQRYCSGKITVEHLMEITVSITQQKTSSTAITDAQANGSISFHGIRKDVTAVELLESKIIDDKLYKELRAGEVTTQSVSEMDSVQKYLQGTNCIAGVFLQSKKQVMSISQAKTKGLLTPGTSLILLEAQAATGFIIDPVQNKKLSVEEAVASGVVTAEWKQKLLSAERAVTGYTDPYTGAIISLFQALQKELIVRDHGIRLLEAQIATGGIIDPVHSHRVPVEVAYQRGYFDEKMNEILLDPSDDTKGFFEPNTKENLTYLQLLERSVTDPETGLSLLVIAQKGENHFVVDDKTRSILKSTKTNKAGGIFHGVETSLWDLLYSKSITEIKRKELLQRYCSGKITVEHLMEITVSITQQKTSSTAITDAQANGSISFHGIRKDVTAVELLESKIIDDKLYKELRAGEVTTQSVSEMDSVQKYLQGTNCIAGVFLQSNKQVMSISQAKTKGLLTPGTSLILLEAQAATGFIIDPVQNKKLSVEEAVASGVVSAEWKQKLLSAERAVTGYTDPSTGEIISLFQALQKELIVRDHGIRLLEAQIATGGIIDPVHSHRVPVEVAYQRGYFDEKMNEILSDPSDDTKGFFDPNTKENLTYLQLLERSVTDPETGLSLLSLNQTVKTTAY